MQVHLFSVGIGQPAVVVSAITTNSKLGSNKFVFAGFQCEKNPWKTAKGGKKFASAQEATTQTCTSHVTNKYL